MTINIIPNKQTGAFIEGVDLSVISDSDAAIMRSAVGEHGVLFFRDQTLSPEAHIRLAKKFGAININRFFTPLQDYPEIAQVLKEPDHKKNIGEVWHTDHSYDQVPALGSILVARELPSKGGDTLFINMMAAYDSLSDDMKMRMQYLTATHSSRHVFGAGAMNKKAEELQERFQNSDAATQDAVHPVVIRHPISGKNALYVNPNFTLHINELSTQGSEDLLQTLYSHCQNDELVYRFKWTSGSVAFWDNRAVWHKALNDYHGQRRFMHRITIEGEAVFSARTAAPIRKYCLALAVALQPTRVPILLGG